MNTLQDVLDLWQSNLQFRTEFKKNPEDALKKAQLQLNANDLEKIQQILNPKTGDSGELDERINK